MRAAAVDARLEAIAGKPYLFATQPVNMVPSIGGTLLAVGRYVPSATVPRQMLAHSSNDAQGYAYVQGNPGAWLAGAATLGRRGTYGNVWWAHMDMSSTGRIGIGRHGTQTNLDWQSDVIGAAYERTLSSAEAMRVIQWLIRHLTIS